MARVLSLSRCPSLFARVELSRAPLTLEHVKCPVPGYSFHLVRGILYFKPFIR